MANLGTLSPDPWLTFIDANGAPYAGAQLFTYAAGTSTKLTTYTNVALTIANANPIILDSAGRATVYLGPAAYKFVLAPSTDTDPPIAPIKTQDDIAAVPLLALHARLASDQTFTTTTLTNITGLSFAVIGSQVWQALVYIHGNSPVAADWKFTVTGPAAPTAVRFGLVGVGAAGATGVGAQSASSFGTAIQVESDGQEEMIILHIYLRNGANSGTVQVQAAQFFASGTTTVRAESIMTYNLLP